MLITFNIFGLHRLGFHFYVIKFLEYQDYKTHFFFELKHADGFQMNAESRIQNLHYSIWTHQETPCMFLD